MQMTDIAAAAIASNLADDEEFAAFDVSILIPIVTSLITSILQRCGLKPAQAMTIKEVAEAAWIPERRSPRGKLRRAGRYRVAVIRRYTRAAEQAAEQHGREFNAVQAERAVVLAFDEARLANRQMLRSVCAECVG